MLRAIPFAMLCLFALPALAQEPDKDERPITDQKVTATDVATTPVSDLNLKKDEIPQLLIEAQQRPYDLAGLKKCPAIVAKVREFDAMLGDDLDLPQSEGRRMDAGRVAQSVVGALIPFRGVIREVSGANNHERKLAAAIDAGIARRSFLKGYGEAKGCAYPGRAAGAKEFARLAAVSAARPVKPDDDKSERKGGKASGSVSKPVIQPLP